MEHVYGAFKSSRASEPEVVLPDRKKQLADAEAAKGKRKDGCAIYISLEKHILQAWAGSEVALHRSCWMSRRCGYGLLGLKEAV
jgi:hypothetical protein